MDPVDIAGNILPTLTDPSPAPQQSVCAAPIRGAPKSSPSDPVGVSVPSSSSPDVMAELSPVAKTTASKMGVTQPRHVERGRSLPHIKVDPTVNSSVTPSIDERCSSSSTPDKQDDISTPVCTYFRAGDADH